MNPGLFMETLFIPFYGMLGVFFVILLIYISVVLMGKILPKDR